MRDWFSLIRNQPCDYFRACFEQQRGGLSGWLCNDSVFQLFLMETRMEEEKNISALEFMATN